MIGEVLKALLGWVVPPDPAVTDFFVAEDSPLYRRREEAMKMLLLWRWKVAISIMSLTMVASWAFSPWGWVTAADITKAVEPVKSQVEEMKSDVREAKKTNREILDVLGELRSVSVGDQIRRLVSQRCRARGYERDDVQRDIDEAQRRYNNFAHLGNYPEPPCTEEK